MSGTSLYLSGTIRPKPSMNQDIQIKAEPTDIEPEETEPKTITSSPTDPHYRKIFFCFCFHFIVNEFIYELFSFDF